MVWLRKWTEPSTKQKLAPPLWFDLKPQGEGVVTGPPRDVAPALELALFDQRLADEDRVAGAVGHVGDADLRSGGSAAGPAAEHAAQQAGIAGAAPGLARCVAGVGGRV